MIEWSIFLSYLLLFISVIFSTIRLIAGPTMLDRILAFDAIALSAAGMLIAFSVQTSNFYFLEVILIFCLLGFTTVVGYMDLLGSLGGKKGGDDVR
jgi:multisubunit Na+/H+ antiporter MnhF subunit